MAQTTQCSSPLQDNPSAARNGTSKRTPKETLTERAYRLLKDEIVHLRLKPGSTLKEAVLCNQFNLGRTPVNYALHRLNQDGLVQILPRKGVRVKTLALADFVADSAVRRVISPPCIAAAALRPLDQQSIERLEALLPCYKNTEDFAYLVNIHQQFNSTIAEAGCNTIFIQTVSSLRDRLTRFWAFAHSHGQPFTYLQKEHAALIECFKRHDADGASKISHRMIDTFESMILQTCGHHF